MMEENGLAKADTGPTPATPFTPQAAHDQQVERLGATHSGISTPGDLRKAPSRLSPLPWWSRAPGLGFHSCKPIMQNAYFWV